MSMRVCVLISCMHQKDASIIERSNVQTDVVVVNQCDRNSVEEFDFINKKGETCHAKFICTTERGLSKSRNMAIRNSWGDICQICDDDEWLADDGEEKILKAYEENPNAALIAFSLIRKDCKKTYPKEKTSLGFKQILKTNSLQITFSPKIIVEKQIWFDEKMGSGTGNGGGEENMFMLDCKRKGLIMLYNPEIIATVNPSPSQWFEGYTTKYFEDLGWVARRLHGSILSHPYYIYFILSHYHIFRSECTWYKAIKSLYKGYFSIR